MARRGRGGRSGGGRLDGQNRGVVGEVGERWRRRWRGGGESGGGSGRRSKVCLEQTSWVCCSFDSAYRCPWLLVICHRDGDDTKYTTSAVINFI